MSYSRTQAEIDPKYHFLFDAPLTDDQGNRSQIRYSRKTKEQYVMSERDGKPSGCAMFNDGQWVEEGTAKSREQSAKRSQSQGQGESKSQGACG